MESLARYTKALSGLVLKQTGDRPQASSPKHESGQLSSKLSHAQIMALPETVLQPIQDMNPASPTFGQFFYMAGYDPLGGAPLGG